MAYTEKRQEVGKEKYSKAEKLAFRAIKKFQDSNREDVELFNEFFETILPTEDNVEATVFLYDCLYGDVLMRYIKWMGKKKAKEIHERITIPRGKG